MNLTFDPKQTTDNRVYESPAVIYDGVIGTRAGSPLRGVDDVDPTGLFDN